MEKKELLYEGKAKKVYGPFLVATHRKIFPF